MVMFKVVLCSDLALCFVSSQCLWLHVFHCEISQMSRRYLCGPNIRLLFKPASELRVRFRASTTGLSPSNPSSFFYWRSQGGASVEVLLCCCVSGLYLSFFWCLVKALPRDRVIKMSWVFSLKYLLYTVELQWLEHLWDHGKLFESG